MNKSLFAEKSKTNKAIIDETEFSSDTFVITQRNLAIDNFNIGNQMKMLLTCPEPVNLIQEFANDRKESVYDVSVRISKALEFYSPKMSLLRNYSIEANLINGIGLVDSSFKWITYKEWDALKEKNALNFDYTSKFVQQLNKRYATIKVVGSRVDSLNADIEKIENDIKIILERLALIRKDKELIERLGNEFDEANIFTKAKEIAFSLFWLAKDNEMGNDPRKSVKDDNVVDDIEKQVNTFRQLIDSQNKGAM